MTTKIAGLLAGCEFVRIGVCEPDEFEQHGDVLWKGARGTSQIVVKPAAGFEFQWDIASNAYLPVQMFVSPRRFQIKFEARTNVDMVELAKLKNSPRVLDVEEIE